MRSYTLIKLQLENSIGCTAKLNYVVPIDNALDKVLALFERDHDFEPLIRINRNRCGSGDLEDDFDDDFLDLGEDELDLLLDDDDDDGVFVEMSVRSPGSGWLH
jgi:hypothetical protein